MLSGFCFPWNSDRDTDVPITNRYLQSNLWNCSHIFLKKNTLQKFSCSTLEHKSKPREAQVFSDAFHAFISLSVRTESGGTRAQTRPHASVGRKLPFSPVYGEMWGQGFLRSKACQSQLTWFKGRALVELSLHARFPSTSCVLFFQFLFQKKSYHFPAVLLTCILCLPKVRCFC